DRSAPAPICHPNASVLANYYLRPVKEQSMHQREINIADPVLPRPARDHTRDKRFNPCVYTCPSSAGLVTVPAPSSWITPFGASQCSCGGAVASARLNGPLRQMINRRNGDAVPTTGAAARGKIVGSNRS